jgi:serine/threonine-protein kinase
VTGNEDAQGLRKYRLIAEIGKGGMADVFLAVVQGPAGFNKLVVIKRTRAELVHDPEFVAMFLDEARLAARLNHPNVVQTHEVGQEGDRYFIAMEYLDGQPLNRVRSRAKQEFSVPMQVRVLSDVLLGLHHAHELSDFNGSPLGVVHRDATPQNVFVTYDGLVKVVDFGIAKAVDSSAQTRTGVVKGKVSYMAPEQARGDQVDRRTDVFAAGVMLWEGIAGYRMWKGVADIVVLTNLGTGRIPRIQDIVPTVDPGLAAICDKALAQRADDRYATALEMHEALEAWLSATPERPTAREVGKFVAERFTDDRAKVKALIEAQLHDVRWSGAYPKVTAMDLPKIDPGQVMITPTGNRPLLTPAQSTGSLTGAAVTGTGTTLHEPAAPPARANRPLVLAAIAGAAALGVIGLGVRFLAPAAQPPQIVTATATSDAVSPGRGAAPTVTPAAGQEAVKLTVRVSPASAKVYLDDVLLSAGGFEGKLVKSDQPRKLRAEAAHYASKEEAVTLTGDVIVAFALEKEAAAPATPPPASPGPGPRARPGAEPPAAPTPPPAPPPAATPPPAPPVTPTTAPSGKRPARAIDSANPFGN